MYQVRQIIHRLRLGLSHLAISRSQGVGRAMLDECLRLARDLDCTALTLDSGTQRQRAHAFYFREGMTIVSFHFAKQLQA